MQQYEKDNSKQIKIDEKLYENPIGKKDIRVAGDCGCPQPKEWAEGDYVTSYHIDSLQGLKLFVDGIKHYRTYC